MIQDQDPTPSNIEEEERNMKRKSCLFIILIYCEEFLASPG